MLHETLSALGLNEKEIEIYLASLTLGTSVASVLANRTKITRSTEQYTCQQLVKKGLMTVVEKGNTFLYTPESPDKLLYFIDQEREVLDNREDQVNRIIGDLKSRMNPHSVLPKVRFYEGEEATAQAYKSCVDHISENSEILGYAKRLEDLDSIPELREAIKTHESIYKKRNVVTK